MKRKQNVGEEMTGRERKKQKMNTARTISVQPTPLVGRSGQGVVNGMHGLPSAIDVEHFAKARAYEIDAMEKAIRTARGASTQRAWQALPRHLRRRAASHDVRRVPVRLRGKAKAEMDAPRKKHMGHKLPKAGKNRQKTRLFSSRQVDKTWLETHVWHAKRMKMENMWGYRLAVQPTEKAYRPSHRASIQGSILHDASYFSTLEVKGPESVLASILELISDLQGPGPGAARWLAGSRVFSSHLYKCDSYPFDLLGPAMILWKPPAAQSLGSSPMQQGPDDTAPTAKGETAITNTKPTSATVPGPQTNRPRTLWLRVHPTIYDDVANELQKATSRVLDRPRTSTEEVEVEIADLRGQINAFEIMGPKSSQIIKGALSPVLKDDREEFKKFWCALTNLQSSGSIPRGTVIGFTVIDPRLKFPPKNATATYKEESPLIFPSSTLAQSDIWEQDIRKLLSKPRYKKKDLDERRSKSLVPGTPLTAQRQDNRVPVLLIQRSLEAPGNESQGIHGWTILLPAGWSMAFLDSLIFTGTRVGGQRERQTQAYEAGTPYFPRDYPFSPAYEAYAQRQEEEERDAWLRKPPAKRVGYQKLETRSPWRADWDIVLGLREARHEIGQGEEGSELFISTQRDNKAVPATDMDVDESGLKPWLFRGADVPKIISTLEKRLSNIGSCLLGEVNKLRQKRSMEPLNSGIGANDFLAHALVNVKIIMPKGGVLEDMGIIYSLTEEEVPEWERLLDGITAEEDGLGVSALQLANRRVSHNHVIGYVTTGHYSLARGEGFALGAIPLTRLIDLKMQQTRFHPYRASEKHTLLVKVRNTNGQQCRLAQLKVL